MSRALLHADSSNNDAIQVFLLGSRLQPPETTGLICRSRLSKRFGDSGDAVLALIQSPPGYGKTCFMAQQYHWLKQHHQKAAWLSLDADSRDLPIFIAHLKGALELAETPELLIEQLSRIGEKNLQQAFSSTIKLIRTQPTPLYVFVDDVHHLAGSDSVRALSMLVDHAPPGLHYILSFRGEPCMSVARQRMHGQVYDVGSRDLKFTQSETAKLMERHGIGQLDQAQLDILETRLEGWAGGLKLAAMLLQRDPDLLENLANFTGERRQFADFFLQDVLSRQTQSIQNFLLQSAILDRLSIPLCNFLTSRNDGLELLRECETKGLFLLPMDEEQRWYRYHPLFAEFLRRHLRESNPGQFEQLNRRASDWFADNGHYVEAFNHALSAGDPMRAAEIMDAHCDSIFGNESSADLLAEKLPKHILEHFPRILLAQTWRLLMGWHFETSKK
ncbi:MAG: hypothetical protein ACRESJ_03600, partial [Pseudomonas sp.]|uniref:hypothetical protein n=1 Tax=Pseudomonas sp. TaxID=306 RepID=UPI003D6EBCDC